MTILEQAQKAKAIGSPLSIEQLVAFFEAKEAKAAKKAVKSNKRWAKREASEKIVVNFDGLSLGERNHLSAANNLPSSMR